jgi:RimJ/RimL family protein N-acetyltransferase
MVVFFQLNEPEYAKWRESAIREHAADLVRAGYGEEERSTENSEKELSSILLDGLKTSGQYICSVVDERDSQQVGVIWYGEFPRRKDTIFIYDIRIDERFRGRGYGAAALRLVEDRARELDKKRIALHVFGHNQRARKLYEELGYKPTSISMAKNL